MNAVATILIVDDSPTERLAVVEALDGAGHRFVELGDGVTVPSVVASEGVDLVVLDVVMLDSNGFQVCRRLRANPATKAIPVVMLSGKVGTADRAWGFDQGADAYIAKPFDAGELRHAVNTLLSEFKS